MRTRLAALLAAAALSVTLAVPASAITFGELDGNRHPNVGALIRELEIAPGVVQKFIWCSGTLIQDGGGDSDLFLTASHCLVDATNVWVTFQSQIDLAPEGWLAASALPQLQPGTAHQHENFACCSANDPFDVGVVDLDNDVAGIAPAPIATPNQLSLMSKRALRNATFVAVGYGTVRNEKEGGFKPLFFDGDRRFAEQTYMNLLKAWLNLSMQPSTGDGGTCYGDSGGPHFLNGVVVSVTVTGDAPCRATDKTYRIDTLVSQEFISRFLDPAH